MSVSLALHLLVARTQKSAALSTVCRAGQSEGTREQRSSRHQKCSK